jgi:hypothetical protein
MERRKSLWNLLLLPLGFTGWLWTWYGLFLLVWRFHVARFPNHDFHDFWKAGISIRALAPSFLMVFAVMPAALGAGLMAANRLVWLIPPVRRALDAEAQEQGTASFDQDMWALLKFTAWALAVGLPVALVAAASLTSLQ